MTKEDSEEKFSFQIEGKDYIISKKSKPKKKDQGKIIHAPSLAIGAVISGICIAVIIFGVENISDEPQQLIETQLVEEEIIPPEITIETFFANASPLLGNPNAPITLVEFGDYQCHFCNVHFHNTEHQIFEKYVMTGKVNVIFKDYTIIGQDSLRASHAAHCASEQGKFWEYHNTLFNNWSGENNGWASSDNLLRFAEQIELDIDEFIQCNIDERYTQKINSSNSDAQKLGITGTPAFYVISSNSNQVQTISGAQPYEVFEKIFNSMLEN